VVDDAQVTTLTRPRLDPIIDGPLVGPRLLALVGDESGCAMWRAWQPVRYLRGRGYACHWAPARDPALVAYGQGYQALLLCRLAWGGEHPKGSRVAYREVRATLRRWKDAGLKVFYEADDDLFTPFVVHQQLGRIKAEKTRAQLEADRQAALWVLGHVDGVTVSTQYLASTVRRYTDAPVEVVPNAIDAGWFLEQQQGVERPIPGPTIGWAGGNRPDTDLEQMAEAWGRIARRFPDVTFVVVGHQPPVIARHVPEGRIKRTEWLPTHEYPKALVGIDIGCCPLEETPFNRSKTPIKAWEYALSGACVVASPTVYGKVIRPMANGLLASTVAEWEDRLFMALQYVPFRRKLAEDLKRDVLTRWALGKNYWRWPLAWHRLMGVRG
jgi:glycosyltransferase involved in cell wall biosynthesis